MTAELLDIWGNSKSIAEVMELCKKEGISVSTPLPRKPSSDALDAPIAFDAIGEAIVVVTAVLNAGVTAAVLTEKMLTLLDKKKLSPVKTKRLVRKAKQQ